MVAAFPPYLIAMRHLISADLSSTLRRVVAPLHAPDQPGRLQLDGPPERSDLTGGCAGAVGRPAVDASPDELAPLSRSLIGVLDHDGRAVGSWSPSLPAEELCAGLRDMMLVRALDARLLRAHRQGQVSFYMSSSGEEAVACGQRRALRDGDMNFPTYRQQGLLVTSGYPLIKMIGQVFSNELDPLHGRQLPVFYSSREHGFFTISGNLATQFVQAVGWAMASAIDGATTIASAWIGEGSTAESDFHAAMVFASTYRAPVVLNVVNNQWAISTSELVARGMATTFAQRGAAYGIPAMRVDGNDYLAVRAASAWAVERARRNLGPTLIEWVTLRVGAHSTSDDPSRYRSSEAVTEFPLGDPIERLRAHLVVIGEWDDDRHEALRTAVVDEVEAAFAVVASRGSLTSGLEGDVDAMFDDVYAEMPRHLAEQRLQARV
jgi:2-oxoisovalerate dehydrogenase E1 component alpha subunit